MNKSKIFLGLLLGTSLLSANSDWDGKYYSVNLNYNHGTVDNNSKIDEGTYYTGNDVELISPHSNNKTSDNNIGVTFSIGTNNVVNDILYGIELDLSLANYVNEYNSGDVYYDTQPTKTFNVKTKLSHDWIVNLQPKIGYIHNSSIFYIAGGLSLRLNFNMNLRKQILFSFLIINKKAV